MNEKVTIKQKKIMIHNKFRYILTLVALFAMTAGAWAQATFGVKEITADMVPADWNGDNTIVSPEDLATLGITFFGVTKAQASAWADYPTEGTVRLLYAYSSGFSSVDWYNGTPDGDSWNFKRNQIYVANATGYRYFVTVASAGTPGPEVTWDPATKTGTFTMPAYDVEIAPIYAPAAQWAKVENVDQLPTAIEGIFAGTTDAIVKAGTVAMMGKTENPQGIVMYAVTSINQATAPELSAFSATVPTAENIADEGADVLIWYYIQGANTPDGQEATAENTFNDSEICATPIKVTVLPNKYDITFKAANANTIEAGKATVKVGDAAATVTEGKLEGVKMGTKVTINAKQGYKFRKVEAKKGAAAAKTITIGDMELTYADGDTWEAIVSKNSDKIKTIAGGYIVQVAQPEPNKYRYIKVVLSKKVNPSDIIDPSKNYEWGTLEVYS
jgi:hypothetical protein